MTANHFNAQQVDLPNPPLFPLQPQARQLLWANPARNMVQLWTQGGSLCLSTFGETADEAKAGFALPYNVQGSGSPINVLEMEYNGDLWVYPSDAGTIFIVEYLKTAQ